MTKEYWLKGKNHRVVHGYLELMIDTVKLFLKGAGGQQVVDDMTEVFNFEKDLSEVMLCLDDSGRFSLIVCRYVFVMLKEEMPQNCTTQ